MTFHLGWGFKKVFKVCNVDDFTFLSAIAFQVTIFGSRHGYEVFVNGEQTHTFSHRYTKLEEIDVLDIHGDVRLLFVQP